MRRASVGIAALAALVALACVVPGAAAQVGGPPAGTAPAQVTRVGTAPVGLGATQPGATLRVSLLTFGPGDAVFERFGHNALRIQDAATGEDLAYNWGMFSFDQPGFLGRFLSGDTRYWVEAFPTEALLRHYATQDRETIEQELALTPAQSAALASAVRNNALEANRYYRYDYFRDNCSTRLRDALDSALAGDLRGRFAPITTGLSYRSESLRLMTPDAWTQLGMDLALGPRADAPLSAWETMFIPMRLRDALRSLTLAGPGGATIPVVRSERVLHAPASRTKEPTAFDGVRLAFVGILIALWMAMLIPTSEARRRRTRLLATGMTFLWYAGTGLVGLVLLGMWLGSAHVFWYENWNLFLLSPLGLLAAFPVARCVWRGERPHGLSFILLALIVFASQVALLGWTGVSSQRLGSALLLLLPANLMLPMLVTFHTAKLWTGKQGAPGPARSQGTR